MPKLFLHLGEASYLLEKQKKNTFFFPKVTGKNSAILFICSVYHPGSMDSNSIHLFQVIV